MGIYNLHIDFPDLGGPTMASFTGTTGGGVGSLRYRRGLSMNFWRFSSVEWKYMWARYTTGYVSLPGAWYGWMASPLSNWRHLQIEALIKIFILETQYRIIIKMNDYIMYDYVVYFCLKSRLAFQLTILWTCRSKHKLNLPRQDPIFQTCCSACIPLPAFH